MVVFWTFLFKVLIIAVLFGFILAFSVIAGWTGRLLTEYLSASSELSHTTLMAIYWITTVIVFSLQYAIFHTIIEMFNK